VRKNRSINQIFNAYFYDIVNEIEKFNLANTYFRDVLTNLDKLKNGETDTKINNEQMQRVKNLTNDQEILQSYNCSIDPEFCKRVEPYWYIPYILREQ